MHVCMHACMHAYTYNIHIGITHGSVGANLLLDGLQEEKQVTHTNARHEQHHKRPHEDHPPHLTPIESGAATVRPR